MKSHPEGWERRRYMGRIAWKTIIKVAEIISTLAVAIISTFTGGKKNDSTRSSKKK